jgi:asparagine synthase (glutamine-hydrolysing)
MTARKSTPRWFHVVASAKSEAAQPLVMAEPHHVASKRCLVVCTGFLANREKLGAELLSRGSGSMHELVAAAYRRWGLGLHRHLLGEYAVAIYDQLSQKLIITKDPLGLRPIYYSVDADEIRCGTHIELVAENREKLNESYALSYMVRGFDQHDNTIYSSVFRLPWGSTLEWSRSGFRIHRTWNLPVADERSLSDAEAEERFRELTREGVRTAQTGRTWLQLSGGLDSSTVAWAARDTECRSAVSMVYPRSSTADERPWIATVVDQEGLSWRPIDGNENAFFSFTPDHAVGEPSRALLNWAEIRAYAALANAEKVDTILSGHGGDQVLYGEPIRPIHLADYLRTGRLIRLHNQLPNWQRFERQLRSKTHVFRAHVLWPLIAFYRRRSLLHPRGFEACPWLPKKQADRAREWIGNLKGAPFKLPSIATQWFAEGLFELVMQIQDSWNQLILPFEIRSPLLYRPLVEFMISLPPRLQVHPAASRHLHRKALRGCLPEAIRTRLDKAVLSQPFIEGLRRNHEFFASMLNLTRLQDLGLVEPAKWRNALGAARIGHIPSFPAIVSTIALELWLRQPRSNRKADLVTWRTQGAADPV